MIDKIILFIQDFSFLQGQIWGVDITFIINGVALFLLIFILYLVMSARMKKTTKKVSILEHKLESYREELSSQIESIKIEFLKPPDRPKKPELVIDEMLGIDSNKNEPIEKKVSQNKIKEANEFFEVPDTAVDVVEKKESTADSSKTEASEPKVEKANEPETGKPGTSEKSKGPSLDISGDIEALLNGDANPEKKKDKNRDSGSVDDLLTGLEDASNPFMRSDESEKQETPEEQNLNDEKIKEDSVSVVSNVGENVSWEDKTALKGNDEVSAVELNGAELLDQAMEEESDLSLDKEGTELNTDSEPDQTKIDTIDQSIDVGSDEISLDLSDAEEPLKTMDPSGAVEEKRASERINQEDIDLELVYEGFTDFIKECSVNISKGGMFIKASKAHPVGTKIKLDVRLKDGYKLIKAQGEVIRKEPPQTDDPKKLEGMGIKFSTLDPESEKLIDKIVQQKKEA